MAKQREHEAVVRREQQAVLVRSDFDVEPERDTIEAREHGRVADVIDAVR